MPRSWWICTNLNVNTRILMLAYIYIAWLIFMLTNLDVQIWILMYLCKSQLMYKYEPWCIYMGSWWIYANPDIWILMYVHESWCIHHYYLVVKWSGTSQLTTQQLYQLQCNKLNINCWINQDGVEPTESVVWTWLIKKLRWKFTYGKT